MITRSAERVAEGISHSRAPDRATCGATRRSRVASGNPHVVVGALAGLVAPVLASGGGRPAPVVAVLLAAWVFAVVVGAARRTLVVPVLIGVLVTMTVAGQAAVLVSIVAIVVAVSAPHVLHPRGRSLARASVPAVLVLAFVSGTRLDAGPTLGVGVGLTALALAGRVSLRRGAPRRAVGAAIVGLVLVGAGWGVLALQSRHDVIEGVDALRRASAAADVGDTDTVRAAVRQAQQRFARADERLSSVWLAPARHLPAVGPNLEMARDLSSGAAMVGSDVERLVALVDAPKGTFVDGRLDLETIEQAGAVLADVQRSTNALQRLLAEERSPWLLGPLTSAMDEARTELVTVGDALDEAHEALRVAPAALGADGPKRYLVLFTTPVEARGRTGFPGNWAELLADDGVLRLVRFGRHTDLDATGIAPAQRSITGPPDYLARYGRFLPAENVRNVALSPDGPAVASVMAELYSQSGGGPLDGVLTVDPRGIAALLRLAGPVDVEGFGEPLTAENAADVLLRRQYLEFANPDRIDFLADAGRATFDRLRTATMPDASSVVRTLRDAAVKGHLRLVSFDDNAAAVLARQGLDGGIPPTVGDDLMVITNNAVGNKIDLFLRRTLDYDVRWDPATGAMVGRLTIALTNDAPASGLPDVVIGSSITGADRPPLGTNRTWLSIYSPWVAERLSVDGIPTAWQNEREAGRWVSSIFLDIGPGATRSVVIEWQGALVPGDDYRLELRAQPLVIPDTVTTSVEIVGASEPTESVQLLDRDRSVTLAARTSR